MRPVLLLSWLLLPVLAGAYHYGPGQQRMLDDEVASILREGDRAAASKEWGVAANRYDDALKLMPAERVGKIREVRLERAKAQMLSKQLPDAYNDLRGLVDELAQDKNADPKFAAEAQETFANCRYYLTWLMRLEGRPRDDWEPEIEGARQTYRLLAEQSEAAGDEAASTKNREDLESAIRLARLDLSELQALPLPSQCKCNGSGKCNCKGKKPGRKESQGEKKNDVRGATSGPPPDGKGS